jgi:hypothetical protein
MEGLILDAPALRLLSDLLLAGLLDPDAEPGPRMRDRIEQLHPLAVQLAALANAATSHDGAHPGDPCVWRLHGPDAEPSPILRIETAHGAVSLDVRTIIGVVGARTDSMLAYTDANGGVLLHFADAEQAASALDRIHAARVQHDDAKAEDRRTERLAEAVARGVAEELRTVLPALGRELVGALVGAVDRAVRGPDAERLRAEVADLRKRLEDAHINSLEAQQQRERDYWHGGAP